MLVTDTGIRQHFYYFNCIVLLLVSFKKEKYLLSVLNIYTIYTPYIYRIASNLRGPNLSFPLIHEK